jgi:adenylyltransferase/sulfurtransferase
LAASPTPTALSVPEPVEERYLRSAALVDRERINAQPLVIVGVGAIGSHLAEMLAKLGVQRLTLIDPDEVDTVNLGVQGFAEADIGKPKVMAVAERIAAIDSRVQVSPIPARFEDIERGEDGVPDGAAVFSAVDSMPVRRLLFRHHRERDCPVFLDGRMASQSLRVFCIERTAEAMELYRQSLFPSHEAYSEGCTARSTIYCATMAAAIMTSQYKQWAMDQAPEPHLHFDLLSMDIFR